VTKPYWLQYDDILESPMLCFDTDHGQAAQQANPQEDESSKDCADDETSV